MEDIFDEEVDVVYIVKKGDANKCDTKSADIPITRQVPGLQGLKKISTERTRKSLKGSLSRGSEKSRIINNREEGLTDLREDSGLSGK
jgi:hypothetical protein